MADESNPFGPFPRSSKTMRTPPAAHMNIQSNQSHILDPSQQSCTMCMNFDTVEMVQCDKCKGWLHFVCAGVTADIAGKDFDFFCQQCTVDKSTASQQKSDGRSRKTKSATSSIARSEARRKQQLALDKLEEERKLREAREKEYLDKKYETLEKFSNVGSTESDSDDDRHTRVSSKEYTNQWVDEQIKQSKEVVAPEMGSVAAANSQETEDLVDLSIALEAHEIQQYVQRKMANLQHNTGQSSSELVQGPNGESGQIGVNNSLTQTTITVPVSIERQPVTNDNQFTQQNSTFRVYAVDQATKTTPSRSDDIMPYESPIVSTRKQLTSTTFHTDSSNPTSTSQTINQTISATKPQSNAQTGWLKDTTSVPHYQPQFANPGVISRSQSSFGRSLFPLASNTEPTSAPNNQQPPTIQLTGSNNWIPTSTVPRATQLFGQSYMDANRLANSLANNCTIVSATQTPPPSSYVYGKYGKINSAQQMVPTGNSQSVGSHRNYNVVEHSVPSYNMPFNSQSIDTAANPTNSWNHRAYDGQVLGQMFSSIARQRVADANSHSTSQSAGYQRCDVHYTQPTIANAFQTTQPFLLQRSTNPDSNSNGYISQPFASPSHQPVVEPNSQRRETADSIGPCQAVGLRLTPEQIAARQVVGRKLPAFYGDVEKFPAWISAYESSTDMCGLTDGENLNRLKESLKGVAMDFVEHQLCYPDDVPLVIDTLKTLWGKPEVIIDRILARISKQAAPQAEDLQSLVKFSMSVQNICGTIKTANLTDHLKNPNLMKQLVDKLPASLQLQWASHKQSISGADMNTLGKWLYELAKLASSISGPPKVRKEKYSENSNQKKFGQHRSKEETSEKEFINAQIESSYAAKTNSPSKEQKKCPVCKQSSCQRVKDCKKFESLNTKDRWSMVKEHKLCIRCFGKHLLKGCKSKQKCNVGECQKPHNSLLHESEDSIAKRNHKEGVSKSDNTANVNCSHQSVSRKLDIFRIVPVKLHHNDRTVNTFAYLDDGSNVTTMEEELAYELDLECSANENLCVKWSFGKIRRTELESRRVSVKISGVHANATVYDLHNVRTVTDLALPYQTISSNWLTTYKHFEGLPITTYDNARPRILIGLQYSKLMVSQKTVEGLWSEPIACKTRLGWVVQGPDGCSNKMVENTYSANICECQPNADTGLHSLVKNFFSWDDFGVKNNELIESKDVQRARKILHSTTRKVGGRYETGLLWRFDDFQFPNSYPMALKRLECLERKMEKDPVLARKMCDYIQDFVEKKYVRKLTENELQQPASRVWYLPIFPVFNPKKPEKFRVVWDAAAMVNKVSLNGMLLAGPDLLKPLPDVIRRFREKPIAIVGDMKEMFHQVQVIGPDVHAQRFLWRDGNSKKKPEVCVMDVLTFGGKNSPCSAQHVKNENAKKYKEKFPRAVEAIVNNHYQDDMLESFDTIDETVRTTEEVKAIHRSGGFEIRNFMSNSSEVLEKK